MIEIREQRGRGDTPFLHRTLETLAHAGDVPAFERAVVLAVGALFEHDSRTGHGATWIPLDDLAEILGMHHALEQAVRGAAAIGLVEHDVERNAVAPSAYVHHGTEEV